MNLSPKIRVNVLAPHSWYDLWNHSWDIQRAETGIREATPVIQVKDVAEAITNSIFSSFYSFAESPFGQDKTVKGRKLECLPSQQAERPVQRSSGAHSKTPHLSVYQELTAHITIVSFSFNWWNSNYSSCKDVELLYPSPHYPCIPSEQLSAIPFIRQRG